MVVKISGEKKLYPSLFFQVCLYMVHRTVIFAVAQLSCYYYFCPCLCMNYYHWLGIKKPSSMLLQSSKISLYWC